MSAKVEMTARLVDRMRAEYLAMPGLKLTPEQARRLWSADADSCNAAFEILLAEGLLHRTGTGKYVALPRPAGAFAPATVTADMGRPQIRCPNCLKLNTIGQEIRDHGDPVTTTFRCAACKRIVSVTAISA